LRSFSPFTNLIDFLFCFFFSKKYKKWERGLQTIIQDKEKKQKRASQ
jgi:hypothetical protein